VLAKNSGPAKKYFGHYFKGMLSIFHILYAKYQEIIVKVREYQDVPVVNLQVPFKEHNNLHDNARGNPIHFNVRGSEIGAQSITKALATLIQNRKCPCLLNCQWLLILLLQPDFGLVQLIFSANFRVCCFSNSSSTSVSFATSLTLLNRCTAMRTEFSRQAV